MLIASKANEVLAAPQMYPAARQFSFEYQHGS